MKNTIHMKGALSIYEDDKLIYRTDNALVHGQKMTGRCMTRLNTMNDALTSDDASIASQSEQLADTYGCIPTAIHIQSSNGSTTNWWMPLYYMESSYTGSSPDEVCTVTYKAKLEATELVGSSFRYIRLGALNNWTRGAIDTANVIRYGQGSAPGNQLLNTNFCGQPAILAYNSLTFLKQEFGDLSVGTVTDTTGFKIYDNGTNWCVALGSALTLSLTQGLLINCSAYGADTLRTANTTNLVQFSSVDLLSDAITHATGKTLVFVWEVTYS